MDAAANWAKKVRQSAPESGTPIQADGPASGREQRRTEPNSGGDEEIVVVAASEKHRTHVVPGRTRETTEPKTGRAGTGAGCTSTLTVSY